MLSCSRRFCQDANLILASLSVMKITGGKGGGIHCLQLFSGHEPGNNIFCVFPVVVLVFRKQGDTQ